MSSSPASELHSAARRPANSVQHKPRLLGPPLRELLPRVDPGVKMPGVGGPFVQFGPFDPAAAAAAAAKFGTIRWQDLGQGVGPVYYDPSGRLSDTRTPERLAADASIFKLMRAGRIPWISEALRQRVYKAHHQAVPPVGYGYQGERDQWAGLV